MSDFHDIPSLERPCYLEMKRFIDQEGESSTLHWKKLWTEAHWCCVTQTHDFSWSALVGKYDAMVDGILAP